MTATTKLKLSSPLDQPERLKCSCGCDHFKINLEGKPKKLPTLEYPVGSINSVECERCHEIYTVEVSL